MENLTIELENQLKENINTHKKILKISKNINNVITTIKKKLKKVVKYYFVEMVVQQLTHNI